MGIGFQNDAIKVYLNVKTDAYSLNRVERERIRVYYLVNRILRKERQE